MTNILIGLRLLSTKWELQQESLAAIASAAKEKKVSLKFYPFNKNRYREYSKYISNTLNLDFSENRNELVAWADAVYIRNIGQETSGAYLLVSSAIALAKPVYDEYLRDCVLNHSKAYRHFVSKVGPRTKIEMHNILREAGCLTPETECISYDSFMHKDRDEIEGTKVVKLNVGGRQGRGVYIMRKIKGRDKVSEVKQHITDNYMEPAVRGGILIQNRVLTRQGDIRLMVINGEIVGGFQRGLRKKTFEATTSHKSKMLNVWDLDPELCVTVSRAATALKLNVCSMDVMKDTDGQYVIIEVNEAPSFLNYMRKTGNNPMVNFFQSLQDKLAAKDLSHGETSPRFYDSE